MSGTLFLRRATTEDAKDILRWRNDPTTRENSFNKDEIDLESHMKWFVRKLGQDDCFMYMLMADDEKVGNIRIDVTNGIGEISYMIAPEHRGKGFGKKIIGMVEKELKEDAGDLQINELFGQTLKSNPASGKCFIANGYALVFEGEVCEYKKGLN